MTTLLWPSLEKGLQCQGRFCSKASELTPTTSTVTESRSLTTQILLWTGKEGRNVGKPEFLLQRDHPENIESNCTRARIQKHGHLLYRYIFLTMRLVYSSLFNFVLCYKIRLALLLFFWLKRKFSTTYLLVFLTMQDSRTRRLSSFFLFDSVHSSDIRFSYLKITHPFRSFLSAIVWCFSQRRIPGRWAIKRATQHPPFTNPPPLKNIVSILASSSFLNMLNGK